MCNKKRTIYRKNLLALPIFLVILSCQIDPIILYEKDFKPELVINGYFKPNDTIQISIKQSVFSPYGLDKSPRSISGATASLYEDDVLVGAFYEKYDYQTGFEGQDSLYYLDYFPRVGHIYRLEVEKEGFESVWAETQIPMQNGQLTDVFSQESNYENAEEGLFDISFNLIDVSGPDYYEFAIRGREIVYAIPSLDTLLIMDGNRFGTLLQSYLREDLDDQVFTNQRLIFFRDNTFDSQVISIDMISIKTPFDYSPPSNFDTDSYHEIKLLFRNVSKEYFDYKFSSRLQWTTYKDPFSEPININGNVHGGKGIFAAYNERTISIPIGFEWHE